MVIASQTLLHWNYFVALESDLDRVSRYIEFTTDNMTTYSIELAHILLAASSEVDVVAKLLCEELQTGSSASNINEYKTIITANIPDFCDLVVLGSRYGLTFTPWINWKSSINPDWWKGYNDVKHERNNHFKDANLTNALDAMAGLLVVLYHYYKRKLQISNNPDLMQALQPKTKLMTLPATFYPHMLRIQ